MSLEGKHPCPYLSIPTAFHSIPWGERHLKMQTLGSPRLLERARDSSQGRMHLNVRRAAASTIGRPVLRWGKARPMWDAAQGTLVLARKPLCKWSESSFSLGQIHSLAEKHTLPFQAPKPCPCVYNLQPWSLEDRLEIPDFFKEHSKKKEMKNHTYTRSQLTKTFLGRGSIYAPRVLGGQLVGVGVSLLPEVGRRLPSVRPANSPSQWLQEGEVVC